MRVSLFVISLSFCLTLSAQKKTAILFRQTDSKNQQTESSIPGNISLLTNALSKQGFATSDVHTITGNKTEEKSFLEKTVSGLRKTDFLFFYSNDPSDEALLNSIPSVPNPASFLAILDFAAIAKIKKFPAFYASQINGPLIEKEPSSLFINVLSTILNSPSGTINFYDDLANELDKAMLLHSSLQRPVLEAPSKGIPVFNKLFLNEPVHTTVSAAGKTGELIIRAGENLSILPGTIVRFYYAGELDTAKKMITSGIVQNSDEFTSTVKLAIPWKGNPETLWAIPAINPVNNPLPAPVSFNVQFIQSQNKSKNTYFETILKEIKENPRLSSYIKTVDKGGDFAISDIGLMSKDSISCTIVNSKTGQPLKDFFYSLRSNKLTYDKNEMDKYSELEEWLVNSAEWDFLSKLDNKISAWQIDVSLNSNGKHLPVNENGYPLVTENNDLNIILNNPGNSRIYFAILALRADKTSKIIYPALGESGSQYFIEPRKTFQTENFSTSGIFGQEKLKIFTSDKPIDLEELREKQILTRNNIKASILPEHYNIQELEYELRSNLYGPDKSLSKKLTRTLFQKGKLSIENTSGQRIYFNLVSQNDDGQLSVVYPNSKYPDYDCQVNPLSFASFEMASLPETGTNMITIFSDRPFQLDKLEIADNSLNDLLASIIKTGRIPGTPLNKLAITQQLINSDKGEITRGNTVVVKLINPKLARDRNIPLAAPLPEFTVNGFALTEENKAVQSVKVNGELVDYDKDLKFFEKVISLAPGRNKIVIEAFDDKKFSGSQILEVDFSRPNDETSGVVPVNYFLGIGIDDYKSWPPLSNAKNDVISFSGLLKEKFGYAESNINLLLDTAATRKNIIRQIRSYLVKAKPNDNIIIYFSGHGIKIN